MSTTKRRLIKTLGLSAECNNTVAPAAGLEPATYWLTANRSTTELCRNKFAKKANTYIVAYEAVDVKCRTELAGALYWHYASICFDGSSVVVSSGNVWRCDSFAAEPRLQCVSLSFFEGWRVPASDCRPGVLQPPALVACTGIS